ncbi:unnamed protein product [Dovyalis caffra]|uniref:Uncharacterized protein n=1 Tax=Dovyalis caffra TaxID=77055 RepID=A0AAV1RSI1_9ROSI|nr:unnamed protein product [Dovyalis caffra]
MRRREGQIQDPQMLLEGWPLWKSLPPSVAVDDDGVRLLEYIIAENRKRKKRVIVLVARHLVKQKTYFYCA